MDYESPSNKPKEDRPDIEDDTKYEFPSHYRPIWEGGVIVGFWTEKIWEALENKLNGILY
jgi:hypothetical protein